MPSYALCAIPSAVRTVRTRESPMEIAYENRVWGRLTSHTDRSTTGSRFSERTIPADDLGWREIKVSYQKNNNKTNESKRCSWMGALGPRNAAATCLLVWGTYEALQRRHSVKWCAVAWGQRFSNLVGLVNFVIVKGTHVNLLLGENVRKEGRLYARGMHQ
jgi:hypothetical protein